MFKMIFVLILLKMAWCSAENGAVVDHAQIHLQYLATWPEVCPNQFNHYP